MPRIENLPHFNLPEKTKAILQKMFANYQRVVIYQDFSDRGFSGSWVIRVHLHRKGAAPELPVVVKIASVSLIQKELQAYKECIQNQLPGIAELRGQPVFLDDLGGLCYPLLGGDVFDVMSLREYCLDAKVKVDDIRSVLSGRLFRIIKKRFLYPSKPEFDLRLRASYDAALPVNLLIEPTTSASGSPTQITPDQLPSKPLSLGTDVLVSGFVVTKVDLRKKTVTLNLPPDHSSNAYRLRLKSVNSLAAYRVHEPMPPFSGVVVETRRSRFEEELLKLMPEFDPVGESVRLSDGTVLPNPLGAIPTILGKTRHLKFHCIHGDLNLENVLVDPQVGDVRLIDFAEARQDHVLHDFLRLETEVVTKLIPQALDEADLPPELIYFFYRQLHCTTFHFTGGGTHQLFHKALEKPFAILTLVRQAARDGFFDPDDFKEYYQCLTLYLVGTLRFKNLDQGPLAPLPKQVAFLGAATILNLMKSSPPCREGPPSSESVEAVPVEPIVQPPHDSGSFKTGPAEPREEDIPIKLLPWSYIRVFANLAVFLLALVVVFYFLLRPMFVTWSNNEGFEDYLAGDLQAAQEKYEWALYLEPDNAETHYNLGLLYQKQHKSERAAQEYQLAISNDFEMAYSKLVGLYIQAGDYEAATLWLTEGRQRVERGSVKGELEELAHQIALWYNNAGSKDYLNGQLNRAQENYKKAIELDSNYAVPHYNLASLYEELVQLDSSRSEYRAAIDIDPDFDAAINNLARLEIEAGNYDHAVQLLLRGLDLALDDDVKYDMLKNLGWARLGQERYAEAISRLQVAIALKPDRAPAYCLLAQVHSANPSANTQDVVEAWENCLKYADTRNPDEDAWLNMAREYLDQGEK